jgi:hypothetical protein
MVVLSLTGLAVGQAAPWTGPTAAKPIRVSDSGESAPVVSSAASRVVLYAAALSLTVASAIWVSN